MNRITQFRAKIPKVTKVFRIIECISLAANIIISIAAFTYFAHKPAYKPISSSSATEYILIDQAHSQSTCSGYKFSSQDSASSAASTINSLNVALIVVAVITLVMNFFVLLVRMVR